MSSKALRKLVPKPVRRVLRSVLDRIPLTVEVRPVRHDPENSAPGRFSYQQRYINFDIRSGDRVLDIGSGGDPFPLATHLVDRFLEPTAHRYGAIEQRDKPLTSADVHHLPFADKSFDFVYCVHVLEHTNDPLQACSEIMRVGKRGYLETPTISEDILFAWARGRHQWHVVSISRTLCFFEYTPRQLEGIRSTVWEDLIMNRRQHPLQQAYFENIDIFDVMFPWTDNFTVYVFHLDGRVETLNAPG